MIGVQPDATPTINGVDHGEVWRQADRERAQRRVKRLQERIVQATEGKKWRRVKNLQRLLSRSWSARVCAVERVTTSRGSRTAGVDGELWQSDREKGRALKRLSHRGYKARPLRRVYIPKKSGGKRMLGIPTMYDRAMQAIWQQALDPVAEVLSDPFSHGFRRFRSCWDAREHIHAIFAGPRRAEWVLDADISKCFDQISHEWLLKNIPMPNRVLSQWLRCGVMEGLTRSNTQEGTPQGGVISPILANLTLNGLIEELDRRFVSKTRMQRKTNPHLLNAVRYADDFLITSRTREFLEEEVIPSVRCFLAERGLSLSESKTRVVHIGEGFNFLGYSVRKYRNGKLLIKPSEESIRSFKMKARALFRRGRGLNADVTFRRLNALISGWGRYFRTAVSKEVFSALDSWLYHKVRRWGLRRHNNWGTRRVHRAYFARDKTGVIRPFKDRIPLLSLAKIPIKRHAKTPFTVNPYHRDHGDQLKKLIARRIALRFPNSLLAGSWDTPTA